MSRGRRRFGIRGVGIYFREERIGENPQAREAAERSGGPERRARIRLRRGQAYFAWRVTARASLVEQSLLPRVQRANGESVRIIDLAALPSLSLEVPAPVAYRRRVHWRLRGKTRAARVACRSGCSCEHVGVCDRVGCLHGAGDGDLSREPVGARHQRSSHRYAAEAIRAAEREK